MAIAALALTAHSGRGRSGQRDEPGECESQDLEAADDLDEHREPRSREIVLAGAGACDRDGHGRPAGAFSCGSGAAT